MDAAPNASKARAATRACRSGPSRTTSTGAPLCCRRWPIRTRARRCSGGWADSRAWENRDSISHMTEERTPAEQIRETLGQIAALDIDRDLVRLQDLGRQVNFEDHRVLFDEVLRFSSICANLPWGMITTDQQNSVLSLSQTLHNYVKEIREFSLTSGGNPADEKDARASRLQAGLDSLKDHVIPFIGYLSWSSTSWENYQQELGEVVRNTKETAQQLTRELEEERGQAEQILAVIRAAAAEQGVSQESMTFREAADRYAASARRWLWAAIGAAVITVITGFIIALVWGLDGQISDAGTLQNVLARAAALAVLVYGTVTAVRLYRSNAHLTVVNRHRDDALRVFQSFVEGTESTDTKDQVLLAAARAAFGQVPTGLVADKGDSASALEVLSGIGSNLTRR